MRLPLATAIALYITVWWITLFAILPLGVRSAHEGDQTPVAGADPGAPVAPKLLIKAAITTVVSAIIFAALLIAIRFVD